MKKPGIPAVPVIFKEGNNPRLVEYLTALQANVDTVTGRKGGRIEYLRSNASLSEVIDKINEILDRLQE